MNQDTLQRLALFAAIVQHDAVLYAELHTRGGGHPQDLARSRMCETFLVLLVNLVPELLDG